MLGQGERRGHCCQRAARPGMRLCTRHWARWRQLKWDTEGPGTYWSQSAAQMRGCCAACFGPDGHSIALGQGEARELHAPTAARTGLKLHDPQGPHRKSLCWHTIEKGLSSPSVAVVLRQGDIAACTEGWRGLEGGGCSRLQGCNKQGSVDSARARPGWGVTSCSCTFRSSMRPPSCLMLSNVVPQEYSVEQSCPVVAHELRHTH